MLKSLSLSLLGIWGLSFNFGGVPSPQIEELLQWQEVAFFQLPAEPDPAAEKIVNNYLNRLKARGLAANEQGIWLQSGMTRLATQNGKIPDSAASLTKIATTLAAVKTWGLEHRFETVISTSGTVNNGVLEGDLVIQGGSDPFFVWEEAIALGNALNELGIRQVTGNLMITGDFYMNFKTNPQTAGQLLKLAFDREQWTPAVSQQYYRMPPGTPQPRLKINGSVVTQGNAPQGRVLVRRQSMSLANILKQMNIFSNNVMAEALAEAVGGAEKVSRLAAEAADVPPEEIQLINGSGLGLANRISPHGAVAMLMALERELDAQSWGVGDLFPVSGRDQQGTMQNRAFPPHTVIKTGTLRGVSALAGVVPTRDRGLVWFALVNQGWDIVELRAQQDKLLQEIAQTWGTANLPNKGGVGLNETLGDPNRNRKR
ncbi:D-alanyl-D-alanine carboxypeptidase [Spirulina sp. CS-785/01]|uniref:D-alanyl-D-alanine carboxypeptidase n=1 Tax=Spirulina sp. CS-785/01 TaxID=3021716 RepID=UPI00232ED1CC|nr:D-alanyl-D-alanine carboxypeptidase [Spirulina sp. CS-785/01]MDB9312226.1 D-alanyl-D-alanine carboxypeptidase [Spirulina sp. CS-785/01]